MTPTKSNGGTARTSTRKTTSASKKAEKTTEGSSGIGTTGKGDPLYQIPLLGDLVERADGLRKILPLGDSFTRGEADVLRKEARALRMAASLLDRRAAQLEKVGRRTAEGERPRVEKVDLK